MFLLGGCVSLDDVVGGIANTPDWFQEKRVEIRGEGYPDFSTVPAAGDAKADQASLREKEARTRALKASFFSDARTAPPDIDETDMEASAAAMRKLLELPAGAFSEILTDQQIEALRKKLRAPPIVK